MSALTIRPAKLYDVPALARIERDSFAAPWSAEEITREIVKNDRAFVAVAEIDGEAIGYADMWIIAGEAQLFNLVVDPAYRRNEVGSRLLEYMLKTAARTCGIMTLEVRRTNIPALTLYRRNGFRETGVRKGYYTDNNEDAILMDRELGGEEIETDYEVSGEDDSLEVDIDII